MFVIVCAVFMCTYWLHLFIRAAGNDARLLLCVAVWDAQHMTMTSGVLALKRVVLLLL